MEAKSEIADWYRGKTVFITGVTGFMGKVLLEKLLRSCYGIGPIYVLVREKKEMLIRDRVEEIMSSRAFDKVRALRANSEDWVIPIPGDISKPDLAISTEHRRLLQESVSVVFHLAATIRFDDPLGIAVTVNVEGTRALMELCLGMTRLEAIVHVSTAYSNCNLPLIEERVYPAPADLDEVTHCVADMDDDLLETNTPRLIGNHANTYTFTKALAEHVVATYSSQLPIAVVRPSIVVASWREPTPGWINCFHGTTGVIGAAAKGLVSRLFGQGDLVVDLIPVDVSINMCIAAAWEIGIKENNTPVIPDVHIYNCVSGPFKSISWNEFVEEIDNCVKHYPIGQFLTCPGATITDSRVKHTLSYVLEHALPATIADIAVWFSNGIPRYRSYQRKARKLMSLTEFFVTHEFEFKVNNVEELWHRLSPVDQMMFNFEMKHIDWKEYVAIYYFGIRRYLLKEKDDAIGGSLQRVGRQMQLVRAVQIGVLVIIGIICCMIYTRTCSWYNVDK